MSVTVTYDFDPKEHYKAARAVTRLTWFRWVPWIAAAIVLLLLAVEVFLPHWGEYDAWELFMTSLPWLLLGVFWIALLPWSQRRGARRIAKRDPSVRGPQERTIDEAGYHALGNGVRVEVPWHAMAKAVESDRFFLFFYNKQCAYYIPKRVLSDSQSADVRTLMKAAGTEEEGTNDKREKGRELQGGLEKSSP